MGNATDILEKRKKYGSSYYSIANDTSKSTKSASDILNNRRINKYRAELQSIDIKSLSDLNEFGLSEEKKNEYKTKLSNYKSSLENLKKYDSSISDNDYNDYIKSLDSLSNKFDVLTQFKSEYEYNAAKNTQKYKDYSYDDIQRTIAIKQRRGDDKSEIEWLKNYALTKDYDTSADYDKGLNKAIDSINSLSKEKSEIQQRMSGYERGHLQHTDQYKTDKERLSEIDKQIEQAKKSRDSLQAGKTLKQRDEKLQNEMSVQNNADFADVSANRDFNNPTRDELRKYDVRNDSTSWYVDNNNDYYNAFGEKIGKGKDIDEYYARYSDSGISDKLGLFLSATDSELNEAVALGGSGDTWANTINEGTDNNWQELKNDEIAIYYYYLNKGEKDNAYKFLSDMAYQLGMRADEKQKAKMEGANALEMIAMNAASVPANVFGGIAAFASDTVNTIKGKDINPYDKAHSAVNFAQNTREETSQRIYDSIDNDFIGTLVSNSYQAVMSGADSLLGAATLGSGYTVTMGMGAASQKAQELYENGASRGQIALGALASGVTEWLTEKLSYDFVVDKLWKNPKSGKDLIKALLASAGNEGIEEVNSDILNLISDSVIQGYNSVSERTVREIMNTSGVSEDEARRQVAAQNAIDIFWSGYGGFISGGLLGGGGLALNLGQSALQNAAYNQAYKQQSGENIVNNSNVDSLVEVARSLDDSKANAKVKALAEEIADTDTSSLSESEQEAFSNRVGKLYSEVQKAQERAYRESDKTAIMPVIQEKIKGKGITDENVINKAADAIYKTVYDSGSLSSSEENLIKRYKLESVANELINDNGDIAAKGEKATKQARNMYLETAELADSKSSRKIDTSDYDISDDGKTYRKDSGEEVKITGVSTIKNGKMMVNLSDGSSTSLDNISLGSNDEAILYEGVLEMGVSAASAQMIIKTYNPSLGMDALNYIRGVQDAVKYGKIGGKAFLNDGVFTSALPEKLRNDMYRIGEIEEDRNAQNKNKAIEKHIKNNKGSKKVAGTVTFKGVNRDNLNAMQKVSVNAVETVFGEMGINVVFFQSPTNKNGDHIGKNGSYDPSTNTVMLDISAGVKGQDTILFTAAHELTHFIAEWSPLKFRKFANFLIENYAKHGQPIEELIREKIASSKKSSTYSKPLTYDQAFEEVVADSCETFLRDSRLTEKLTELAKADMTLFERIKLYINDLLEKLKKAYAGLTPDSREGKIVLDMKNCIEELHSMWEEAALDARNNFQSAGGKSLRGNKNTADEDGVKYSFAGERAANADKSLLEIAKQRIENGEDSEAIRKETGWFKGYDGKWRFELDDSDVEMLENNIETHYLNDGEMYRSARLEDVIDHIELFASYPQLKDYTVIIQATEPGVEGSFHKKGKQIVINQELFTRISDVDEFLNKKKNEIRQIENTPEFKEYNKFYEGEYANLDPAEWLELEKIARDKFYNSEIGKRYYELNWGKSSRVKKEIGWSKQAKAVLLHEIQHAIQEIEGFASGASTNNLNYDRVAGEIESRDVEKRLNYTAEQRKSTRPDIDRTDVVFAESAVSYFSAKESNNSSIKQQLREHLNEVNAMLPVAEVQYSPTNKKNLRAQAVQEFKKIGYKVERQGFGVIEIGDKQIEKSLEYITTDGERAALLAVPKVLKRGIEISGHKDHKGRSYGTVTIAAPVSINGKIGDIAVVVKITGKNRYSTHRILMPDGSEFVFEENKNTEPTSSDMLAQKSDQGTDISSVFDNTVPQKAQSVNTSISENFENSTEKLSDRDYSYDTLVSKPDMKFTVLSGNVPNNRADVVYYAKKNAAKVGKFNFKDGSVSVHVDDINTDIVLSTNGLKHGLDRRFDTNAPVTLKAGEILQNSIKINELTPKKEEADNCYVLIGAAKKGEDELYIVQSVINKFSNELLSMDVLYAINAKKENRLRSMRPGFLHPATDSTISISELLDYVNKYFPDILPESVLKHYGHTERPEGKLGESALFSDRDPDAAKAYAEINKQIIKENASLSEEVENLKELAKLQKQLTHGKMFTKTSVESEANVLMKYVNAKGDKSELISLLNDLYSYIVNGEELSWDGIKEKAAPAVNWLQEHEYHKPQRDEYASEVLKHLRTLRVSLNDEQKQEVASVYGSYNEFRKKNMGRIIFTDDGTPLDTQWQELSKMYPAFFDSSVIAENQPIELMDIIYNLQSSNINGDYYFADEMAAQDLLVKVYEGYWNLSTLHTFADVKQKEINLLKAKHNDRISALRKAHNEKDAKLKQEYTEKTARLRKQYRDRETAKLKKISERYQESRKKTIEGRKKTEMRHKIIALQKDFEQRLIRPHEGKYVPKSLISSTVDLLKAINMDTGRSEKASLRISDLRDKYDKLKNDNENYAVYDEGISEMLLKLTDILGDTSIKDMSLEQLNATYTALKAMNTVIKNSVKMVDTEFKKNAYELGNSMILETRAVKHAHNNLASKYVGVMLRPDVMFEQFGGYKKNSVWSQMAKMLNDGQLKTTRLTLEFSRMFDELISDTENLKKLSTELVDIGLSDDNGNSIEITRGMMLTVYMHLMNEDNIRHIMSGGMTVPEIKAYYKGDTKKAFAANSVLARGISVKIENINKDIAAVEERLAQARSDGEDTVAIEKELKSLTDEREKIYDSGEQYIVNLRESIENKLSDYEKLWITAAHEFFDVASRKELNSVSLMLYGFDKANVKSYFPIHTDSNYRAASFEQIVRDMSLENVGFMKERVVSSNPILLEDITDVISNQIKRVAQYCGMTIPIKNFQKVYGTTAKGFESSVQKELDRKFSGYGKKYIENLLTDLTSGRKDNSPLSGVLSSLRGNVAQAVLTINPRVAIAQAASYPTAAAEIGWEPLLKALRHGGKNDTVISKADKDLIAKYSPLLWYRMQGYSTTEIGDLKNQRNKSAVINKKLRLVTGWIQAMDGATVGRLWYASQYYVEEHSPDIKKGTDEYYMEVAKVFNRVVEKTQPNYTTMQRPEALRAPGEVWKSLVMFMTQRLQNFNIIYDSANRLVKYKNDFAKGINDVTAEDVKDAKDTLVRSVSSQLAAGTVIVAMKLISDLLFGSMNGYRDDDDELTAKSVSLSLLDNFFETLVSSALWGSEVYSFISSIITQERYYGISINGIDSFTEGLENIISVKSDIMSDDFSFKKLGKDVNSLAKCISQLLGIPLGNAEKIGIAVINHIKDCVNGEFFSFESGVDRTNAQEIHRAQTAYELGNTEKSSRIIKDLIDKKVKSGKTQKEAKSAVRASLTSTYKPKYIKAYKNGDEKEKSRIRSFLYSTGIYGSLSEVDSMLKKWLKDDEDE